MANIDFFDLSQKVVQKIREILALVDIALSENDKEEAKKLLADAKKWNGVKQELLKATKEKFGERFLSKETKEMLGSMLPSSPHVDADKEMKMFGPKDREVKEKPMSELPMLKKPVPFTPPKPSEDIDEAPIDLTSSEAYYLAKIAAGDVKEFKLLLSFLRALAHIYQYMHWRSAGTNYYGDHLLYERLYNSVEGEIDPVAEKVLGITNDSKSIHPIEDMKYTSAIVTRFIKGEFNPESFAEIGLAAEKELIKLIEKMMSGDQSDGVENMLQGIADKHEGHLYLLQQRNKTAAAKIGALIKMANKFDAEGNFELANQIDEIINALATTENEARREKEYLFGTTEEKVEAEMAQIVDQIHKLETRKPLPYEDESNYQTLSFLREKYKALSNQLSKMYEFSAGWIDAWNRIEELSKEKARSGGNPIVSIQDEDLDHVLYNYLLEQGGSGWWCKECNELGTALNPCTCALKQTKSPEESQRESDEWDIERARRKEEEAEFDAPKSI